MAFDFLTACDHGFEFALCSVQIIPIIIGIVSVFSVRHINHIFLRRFGYE